MRGERWVAKARGEVGGGGRIWIGERSGGGEGSGSVELARERKEAGEGWMEIYQENISRVSGLVWMGRGQPLDPRASDGVGCTIRVICPRTNQNAVRFYDHLNWS